jgi:hypothetical protein
MRLGVAWLQPSGLFEFRLCLLGIPRLQQHEPEIVVSLGKFWILSNKIAKNIDCRRRIVVLAQDQSQLHPSIDVVRIEAGRVRQLANGFWQAL